MATVTKEKWAPNVVSWDEEKLKLLVRSLDPKFTNTTFIKRKGNLVQLDCAFIEVELEPNASNKNKDVADEQIVLQDKSVSPHTTLLLPLDVAALLLNQLNSALAPQQQENQQAPAEAKS